MSYNTWHNESKSLQVYLNEVSSSKPLDREAEKSLGNRISAGDDSARDELVQANLLFVISVAQKYQHRGLTMGELISAGNMGLMTAASRFDPSRGFKFISYAVWWIRQAIFQALNEDVRTVHLPLNKVQLLRKISQISQRLADTGSQDSGVEEIAAALDVSAKEVHDTVLSGRKVYSLDQEWSDDDERSLMQTLVDESQDAPDADILRQASQNQLDRILDSLDDREQRIVRLYFGLDGDEPLTLEQIGGLMSLTRERIRQLKERAFHKLRHPSRQTDLSAFERSLDDM